MKLWILAPAENLSNDDNPWNPWFDKSFGFVVRAQNEKDARSYAHQSAGDENEEIFLGRKTSETNSPWLDPKYSTCVVLTQDGDLGVIMSDFHYA